MAKKRPMISLYEVNDQGQENLVYREMTSAEFKEHTAAQEAIAKEEAASMHPLVRQVRGMSKRDKAALKKALG